MLADENNGKRIAWLIAGDEIAGVAQAVRGLTVAVRPLGIEPIIIAFREGPFCDILRSLGFGIHDMNVEPLPVLFGGMSTRIRLQLQIQRSSTAIRPRLAAMLRKLEVKGVHVVWRNIMPLAAMAARDADIPCFWEMSNIMGHYPFAINRKITQHTLRKWNVTALANSRYTAATLGDDPVKPIVMYLGADEQRFDPDRVDAIKRTEIGIPAAAINLGIFARIKPAKGQARILEAMAQLPPQYANTHLLLLGGPNQGGFADELRALAKRLGLAERLHILGNMPDPERYYEAIDVAINARIDPEPFGLSVVEAMMMGKPVLVHSLGGPAETVIDGQTGWHVHEPTVEGFKAGLLRALGEREKWAAMGAAGRQRALEQFSLSRQAKQYVDIVRHRLGKPAL
ncbi:MAG: glycosyltransferase family 4 protein [Planctomycetia bacterium]|nr:glycosyltransferase family 4 protein [Planctomycetia bacterium]